MWVDRCVLRPPRYYTYTRDYPQHRLTHHPGSGAPSLCIYVSWGLRLHWRLRSENEATGAYAISGRSTCVWRCGVWKKRHTCMFKNRMGVGLGMGGGGSNRATKVHPRAVRQQSASLLPGVRRKMQPVREWGGLAEWLHITLSAPATSYLYCNANPRPVPDGAVPASWRRRNMIIYQRHSSSF